jgi:hypothetical protein
MLKILTVLLTSLVIGALLASGAGVWPLRPGLCGAALMLLTAAAVRYRWGVLADAAPGSPERALWVSLAGNAVVAAHLFVVLLHIGPDLLMHTPVVHAMGVDIWTLVGGSVLAHWIARDPQPRFDERDQWIAQRGLRAAHYALLLLLLLQILTLGFVHSGWVAQLSRPSIAHVLILAIIVSVLIDRVVCLYAYARDAALEAAIE